MYTGMLSDTKNRIQNRNERAPDKRVCACEPVERQMIGADGRQSVWEFSPVLLHDVYIPVEPQFIEFINAGYLRQFCIVSDLIRPRQKQCVVIQNGLCVRMFLLTPG
jgi:hypothetical protein